MGLFEYMNQNPLGTFLIASSAVAGIISVLNNVVKVWGARHRVDPDELEDTED